MNNHPVVSFCLLFLSVGLGNWLAIQRAKKCEYDFKTSNWESSCGHRKGIGQHLPPHDIMVTGGKSRKGKKRSSVLDLRFEALAGYAFPYR